MLSLKIRNINKKIMRITPLEIRQHTFDKSFRGYDTESVDAFLLSLSQEWERISEDVRHSKQQLEVAEKEIVRMKEIENSLFKTLKAAEDAQQNINAKAEAEASLITDKARLDAEEITNEAQKKVDMMVSESENKAKFLVEEAVNDLKNYERDFKAMERYKDYLVVELKSFANDALDKVTKFEERINARTSEARLNELDIKIAEKIAEPLSPVVIAEPVEVVYENETEPIAVESIKIEEPVIVEEDQSIESEEVESNFMMQFPPKNENKPTYSIFTGEIEEPRKPVVETEIDFNPANDFDDENEELPTVHTIAKPEPSPTPTPEALHHSFNETADNLMKEMKATRGRPRKITTNDGGLPTVSSVMEEFTKDAPATISNGGGSFFDNI
jgi:cell division initiation protein